MKVGYRTKKFNAFPIVKGRERVLILGNDEKRNSLFAICELESIIASHNEKTFGNSDEYPLDANGRNVNDRNYAKDENAQAKVQSVAQGLEPNIIISTSATASGSPIITLDGIVVSGNNRVMSLKLAKNEFEDNYDKYLTALYQEVDYGGYGIKLAQVYEKFKFPVLVRIDLDFKEYNSTELNKYNTSRAKSEKQVDKSIRISQLLQKNENCQKQLIDLINEQEMVSELYNSSQSVSRFKKIMLSCGLITDNDISALFTSNSLTEQGKIMYNTILLGLVLNENSIEISQNDGVKSYTKNVVNAILPLIKNKSLQKGSIINVVNNSFLIQNDLVNSGSSLNDYIKQTSFDFEEVSTEHKDKKSLIVNAIVKENSTKLKNVLNKYNNSMEQNIEPDMFGEQLSEDEIFTKTFADEVDKKTIELIKMFSEKNNDEIVFKNKNSLSLDQNQQGMKNENKDWLFKGGFPTGTLYADKTIIEDNDYKKIAMVFSNLQTQFVDRKFDIYYKYKVKQYSVNEKYQELIDNLKKEYDYPLLQEKYKSNESVNNHSANVLILADYFGTNSDKEIAEEYYKLKQSNKQVDSNLQKRVDDLNSLFYNKLFDVKEDKKDLILKRIEGLELLLDMEDDKDAKKLLETRISGLKMISEDDVKKISIDELSKLLQKAKDDKKIYNFDIHKDKDFDDWYQVGIAVKHYIWNWYKVVLNKEKKYIDFTSFDNQYNQNSGYTIRSVKRSMDVSRQLNKILGEEIFH